MAEQEPDGLDERLNTCGQVPSLDFTLAKIRQWAERREEEDPEGRVVRGRVQAEIGHYLGTGGAGSVLNSVSGGQDLLPKIEPILKVFLGCRAASRLLSHIVDRAIVRI